MSPSSKVDIHTVRRLNGRMKKPNRSRMALASNTVRILNGLDLNNVQGGRNDDSGSAGGLSVTCAPTKNGDGAGCLTGLRGAQ